MTASAGAALAVAVGAGVLVLLELRAAAPDRRAGARRGGAADLDRARQGSAATPRRHSRARPREPGHGDAAFAIGVSCSSSLRALRRSTRRLEACACQPRLAIAADRRRSWLGVVGAAVAIDPVDAGRRVLHGARRRSSLLRRRQRHLAPRLQRALPVLGRRDRRVSVTTRQGRRRGRLRGAVEQQRDLHAPDPPRPLAVVREPLRARPPRPAADPRLLRARRIRGLAPPGARLRRWRGVRRRRGAGRRRPRLGSLEWVFEFPSAFIPTVVARGAADRRRALPAVPRRARSTIRDRHGRDGARRARPAAASAGGSRRSAIGLGLDHRRAVVFFTEAKLIQSESAAERSDLEDAAQDARDAATLQPWSAEPWIQIALLEELSGDLVGAQEAMHTASVRAPEGLADLAHQRPLRGRARRPQGRARVARPRARPQSAGPDLPGQAGESRADEQRSRRASSRASSASR